MQPSAPNISQDQTNLRKIQSLQQWSGIKQVDLYAGQDKRLSAEARGVIFYLISRPEGWVARAGDIMNEFGFGRDAWRSVRDNLVKCGYLTGIANPPGYTWVWRTRPDDAWPSVVDSQ